MTGPAEGKLALDAKVHLNAEELKNYRDASRYRASQVQQLFILLGKEYDGKIFQRRSAAHKHRENRSRDCFFTWSTREDF